MAITKIATITVGAGGAATMDFASIPATGTDLLLIISARYNDATGGAWSDGYIRFNGSSSNLSMRMLYGVGSGALSLSSGDINLRYPGSGATANTFSSAEIYIPNAFGNTNKSLSADVVTENNAQAAIAQVIAGLWASTSAITSISLGSYFSSFAQYSTASLYSITKGTLAGVTVS